MRTFLALSFLGALTLILSSFCGFYVARADIKLLNEASQVILARDGNRSVVTMWSDFKGDVSDFAMVVPVPEVIGENDIRVVPASIFERFELYSSPRLAEYYDVNPCQPVNRPTMVRSMRLEFDEEVSLAENVAEDTYGITIEAEYTVGEYDIIILSAKESGGLKQWLNDHDYQIPADAHEVLNPYIKSGMKFFVVKVNLEEHRKGRLESLRPIQISYEAQEFMLPIRLGMANANGNQDLIVYALTRNGRIETTNYRTVELPTNKEVPLFVQEDFGTFYNDLFKRAWNAQNNAVFLEYAWDISSRNFVKCDPCATTPPSYQELSDAGVFWVQRNGGAYQGDVFFTRLHVRYNRSSFPQDLLFQTTPNKTNYQCRYVIHHPAPGDLSCDAAQQYLKQLVERRKSEIAQLYALTGSRSDAYDVYYEKYEDMLKRELRYESPQEKHGRGFNGQDQELPPALRGSALPGAPIGQATPEVPESIHTPASHTMTDSGSTVTTNGDAAKLEPEIRYVPGESAGAEASHRNKAGMGYLLFAIVLGIGGFYVIRLFQPTASAKEA